MNDKDPRQQLFDQILNEHSEMIARICYMYGADSSERDDLYQECMMNVWEGLKRFRGDSKLSTWLYRACINTCITNYRRRKKKGASVSLEEAMTVTEDANDKASEIKELYRLVGQLGDVDKAIIMMWLEENSYDEISEIMGIPRNTVASKLRRIKERLVNLGNS